MWSTLPCLCRVLTLACVHVVLGFVKIHCRAGSDEILGGTIVAEAAGEMISELTLAVQFKIGLGVGGLGGVIHSYPTVADAIGGCAFGYKMKHWSVAGCHCVFAPSGGSFSSLLSCALACTLHQGKGRRLCLQEDEALGSTR